MIETSVDQIYEQINSENSKLFEVFEMVHYSVVHSCSISVN